MGADPAARFADVVAAYVGAPGTTAPDSQSVQRFGSTSLKANGKIFAMLVKGRLVLKLPRARVEQLVGDGAGANFDPGHGRLMREWFELHPDADLEWVGLAGEARQFVVDG